MRDNMVFQEALLNRSTFQDFNDSLNVKLSLELVLESPVTLIERIVQLTKDLDIFSYEANNDVKCRFILFSNEEWYNLRHCLDFL